MIDHLGIKDALFLMKDNVVNSCKFVILPTLDSHNAIILDILNHKGDFLIVVKIDSETNVPGVRTEHHSGQFNSLIVSAYMAMLHNI